MQYARVSLGVLVLHPWMMMASAQRGGGEGTDGVQEQLGHLPNYSRYDCNRYQINYPRYEYNRYLPNYYR